ncbi:MAG: TIM barrel protein [Verrucomicrobia bacterium]|nr:TIM barrel protein [Verrucomicrobiota bacterium]MDA1065250.1 TIM barrel protein [Verrucomicrobiota bacterium]
MSYQDRFPWTAAFHSEKKETFCFPRRTFLAKLGGIGLGISALSGTACRAAPKLMARPACQTNAWPISNGMDDLISVLKTIKTLGFRGYETSFRNVQETFSNPELARAKLEATGLEFVGMHIAAPDQYEPETSIPPFTFLQEMADGASGLGAEYLILSGRGVAVEGQLDRAALKRKIDALLKIGEYCQSKGVKLTYHHHVDDFLLGGAEIDDILERSDPALFSVWLCTDAAIQAEVDLVNYFIHRHKRIAGIHVKDTRDDRQVILGQGVLDGVALAEKLQKAAWSGWLLVEEERGRYRKEWPGTPAVQEARQHMKQVFGI